MWYIYVKYPKQFIRLIFSLILNQYIYLFIYLWCRHFIINKRYEVHRNDKIPNQIVILCVKWIK